MPQPDRMQEMTRAGLNLIGQALSIYDADLRLAVSNRPFQQMFRLPEHLVQPGADFGETIRWLVEHGEYGDVLDPEGFVAARVEQALAFEPHYMERQRANGRTISVEGSPLPEGGWVTVYTDITEIKAQEALLRTRSAVLSDQLLTRAEQLAQTNRQLEVTIAQLEEAKRGLAEMEARTRTTTEMMPAHIARVDRAGHYTYTNRRVGAVFPGRESDILGRHYAEVLGAETGALLAPALAAALKGEAMVREYTDEPSARRIRTAFTPDTAPDGSVTGVYVLSTDVTEEAQARAALAQTHKRELAAQLTSGLAHDFANLLTIILGLQGRLEKLDLPDGARELIGATQAAARRGGVLLDKIATISGPRVMHPEPVDPEAFFDAFAPLARAPLPEEIALDFDIAVDHPALMLDTGALQDSLLNLVLNARDAIGPGGGRIVISARAVRDTWLEISVEDTGPGFSDTALTAALDPFYTTKGAEGSGLGLTMVYDQVKLAGGQVRLANTGSGARITLRLPLRPAGLGASSALVLLVEDDPDLRASIREMLTELGHQVLEAAGGDEALALAGLSGIDWVLSDINLAGEMTGVELCAELAGRHPHLKLALMTARPADDGLRRAGAARWPVLAKPLDPAALGQLIAARAVA
ncbi:response regulator [Rhodobacterales bacterium HKCCE3408]|nr:response regulator [Rhodobacterales bacterium HKCCE3408]